MYSMVHGNDTRSKAVPMFIVRPHCQHYRYAYLGQAYYTFSESRFSNDTQARRLLCKRICVHCQTLLRPRSELICYGVCLPCACWDPVCVSAACRVRHNQSLHLEHASGTSTFSMLMMNGLAP